MAVTGRVAPIRSASSNTMPKSLRIQSRAKPWSKWRSSMVPARFSICHDPEAPWLMAASTLSVSSPALREKSRASARPWMRPPMQTWLTILVSWPLPTSPTSTIALA